jgi:hypothetical protein
LHHQYLHSPSWDDRFDHQWYRSSQQCTMVFWFSWWSSFEWWSQNMCPVQCWSVTHDQLTSPHILQGIFPKGWHNSRSPETPDCKVQLRHNKELPWKINGPIGFSDADNQICSHSRLGQRKRMRTKLPY